MENLLRERARAAEDAKRIRRKKKKEEVAYTLNGKKVRDKLPLWKRIVILMACVLTVFLLIIYVPPFFYKEENSSMLTPIVPDTSAIKNYVTYLKDHPDADFDSDGLPNQKESEYETNPWKRDTDGDGVSDYGELFVTETSPVQNTDILIKEIIKLDEIKKTVLGTPYKIDDVICWPDTYKDKAHGAVLRTERGYKFCTFTGWVRFPEEKYAYRYHNGIHYELAFKEEENAYRIDSEDEIVLYDEPLEFVHRLKLPFFDTIYLRDDRAGNLLSHILPDYGSMVLCERIAMIDKEDRIVNEIKAELKAPFIPEKDMSRFGRNMNTLDDLVRIRSQIDQNECVAVSLYSGNTGEVIGILYGYTDQGDFLVADRNLNPVGKLEIEIRAERSMNGEGSIEQESWYEWKGLGFDSKKYGDRINYFASTITSVEVGEDIPKIETSKEETVETITPTITPEPEKMDKVITFTLS